MLPNFFDSAEPANARDESFGTMAQSETAATQVAPQRLTSERPGHNTTTKNDNQLLYSVEKMAKTQLKYV